MNVQRLTVLVIIVTRLPCERERKRRVEDVGRVEDEVAETLLPSTREIAESNPK